MSWLYSTEAPAAAVTAVPLPERHAPPADVPEPPPRCAWLAAEGLVAEAKAMELENGDARNNEKAIFQHQRAAEKLSKAAELCPEGHPDGPCLREHASGILLRAVYLESLGGAAPTLPIEDHVGELTLRMDLSAAPPPQEEQVPSLIARSGTSGSNAELNEAGYKLVAALENPAEMRTFAERIVLGNRRRRAVSASDADVDWTIRMASSYEGLQQAVLRATWVELDLDPKMDRIDMANKFKEEGASLEAQGQREEAAEMYRKALAVFQYAHKNDERCKKFPKVKEAIQEKIEELSRKVAAIAN